MIDAILPPGIVTVEADPAVSTGTFLLPDEAAALGVVAEGRRREFTAARSCARRALEELGVPVTAILTGPRREPLWPTGVVGSITHCAGYCAAVVARRTNFASIGIDAEIHEVLPHGVLDLIALGEEQEWLRAQRDGEICWDRVLFSAKESVYKTWYPLTGKSLELKDSVVTIDPSAGTFHASLQLPIPIDKRPTVTGFDGRYLLEDGYVLTAIVVGA
jgi:4'-phosphopantetheinyl transferase EntD